MYGICVTDNERLVGCSGVKDLDGEFVGILVIIENLGKASGWRLVD